MNALRAVIALACFCTLLADGAAFAQERAESPGVRTGSSCPDTSPQLQAVMDQVRERMLAPNQKMDLERVMPADMRRTQAAQREADWPNLCRYKAENARATTRPDVVFMGDSITENWVRADPSFFSSRRLGRGIAGQTAPQMLVRFYQDVIDLKPRAVHIMAGTNDVAGNTGPSTDDEFKDNIRAMVELARASGIRVILASIPPAAVFPWAPSAKPAERIRSLNAWLKQYSTQRGLVYADYYAPLVDEAGGLPAERSNDGVHPNRPTYIGVMQPVAVKAIELALKDGR